MSRPHKITENHLKIAQQNIAIAEHWAHFLEESYKLNKGVLESWFNFPQQQIERILDCVEVEATLLPFPCLAEAWQNYSVDVVQRNILFWDVLRKRGNQYLEYINAGSPPVLIFNYEVIVDGRKLKNPINYALVSITPPQGVKIDNTKRPFLIVDPRAGHGAGIGGFKDDSQVGMALRAGHPVYFVIFFPEPEPKQTLRDIAVGEKFFVETIISRHPSSPKPCIIGNCQGGWAVMALAAAKPDIAGVLVINGAPISYWSGENGKNPMRYVGGLIGGSWLVQFACDLGNDKFDGAHLVNGFEVISPEKSYWEKYYNLFVNIDTEENRFLAFERWWGGFYALNADEIRSIIDNLFIGNFLSHGRVHLNRSNDLDLRNIKSPIVIFCSLGDEITSTQQALNWISDVYENEFEIKAAGQTIVYLIHPDAGHLGIFVSSKIAAKEHREIIDLLNHIEYLPSGLYEMIIRENPKKGDNKVKYEVALEERRLNDIVDTRYEAYKKQQDIFRTMRSVVRLNSMIYDIYCSPIMRAISTEESAEVIRQLHPLRISRYLISDLNPFFKGLSYIAEKIRAERASIEKNNLFLLMQEDLSRLMISLIRKYKFSRDNLMEIGFYTIYGLLASVMTETIKHEKKLSDLEFESVHEQLIGSINKSMTEGDAMDAILRILLLILKSSGIIHLAQVPKTLDFLGKVVATKGKTLEDLHKKGHLQSILIAYDEQQALLSLPKLIPKKNDHKFVMKTLKAYFENVPLDTQMAEKKWAEIQKIIEEQR